MKPACRKSSSIGQHQWRTVPSGTSPHRGDFRAFPTVYVQYTTFVCTTTYQTEFVGGMPSTCKEIKQLERPRLALFASSHRGESHSAETIIQLPSKSFPHAAFPFVFGCGGGGGGSCVASSSSSSSFSSRLKTLGSCSSLMRLHSAFNLLRSSEVILRGSRKSPASGLDSFTHARRATVLRTSTALTSLDCGRMLFNATLAT
jgi:hypothetical protein